jgi:periplasmic divalent cation tolerance protein
MHSTTDIVILYIPCGSEVDAQTLSLTLLERGLIACANIYPSRSIYRWKGEVADQVEHVIFAKTTAALAEQAAAAAEQLHGYDIPCVLVFAPESANAAYARWVESEVSIEALGKVAD